MSRAARNRNALLLLLLLLLLLPALLAGLCACGEAPPAAPAVPVAETSIQELMQSLVDPAADALWESVSSTSTLAGLEEKQPRSEDDWRELRHQAVRLIEAGALLRIEGRPVTVAGQQVEDHGTPGVSSAAEVARDVAARRARFNAAAQGLSAAGRAALVAIDARDVGALLSAGATLDRACEHCHQSFWYPQAAWPAPFSSPAASQAAR